MSVTHWIEWLFNKLAKDCQTMWNQSSHSLALIDYYYYAPSTQDSIMLDSITAWINQSSKWIDQWSSSILVGFLITKMLTYIPNTYSIPAHKAVKEWMACFGCSCASAQFKYIIWGPCSHFFASKFTKSNEVASLIAFFVIAWKAPIGLC